MKKNLTRLQWTALMLLFTALLLTGCKSDPNEDFIQGIWYYNSEHLANIPAESHQSDNWLFERRTFQNASCCFTKTNMRGSYRVLESEENTIELELYDIVGDQGGAAIQEGTTVVLTIVIDRENDTLKINRAEPYTRITP